MERYYLAYGSNLNVEQMQFRCPDAKIIGTAFITDYQLLYKGSKTGSYLTIEKKKGSVVPVAVWSVSDSDECNLDRYEGYPTFYYKKDMKLSVNLITGETVELDTFVYIMHEDRKLGIPSDAYIRTCNRGYEYFGFDKCYLAKALKITSEGVK